MDMSVKPRRARKSMTAAAGASAAASAAAVKPVNLALQGGGAHGAFTWGVLDHLL